MGVKVAAHVEGLDGAAAAIGHGMDTIEHGMYLNQRPDLLEQMAARGQVLVPTLSGYYWMGGLANAIDPATATVQGQMLPSIVELAHYNLEQGTLSMRSARQAGVRIALGSDGETVSGQDTALELVRMVHHGLSPSEALRSATSVAAEAIGLQNHIGTVQAGKLADLLVVDGDVVAHPELLLDPAGSGSCCSSANPSPGLPGSTPALEPTLRSPPTHASVGFRVPLASRLSVEQAVLWLRGDERPFVLAGDWLGGAVVIGSQPVTVAGTGADPFALMDAPVDGEPGEVRVGGGWIGWLGYGLGPGSRGWPDPPAPSPRPLFSLAFYDHVIVLDEDGWWFEALMTPEREAALPRGSRCGGSAWRTGRRPARREALALQPRRQRRRWVTSRPWRSAANGSRPASCSRPTSACGWRAL